MRDRERPAAPGCRRRNLSVGDLRGVADQPDPAGDAAVSGCRECGPHPVGPGQTCLGHETPAPAAEPVPFG